tara:strand:+ start:558 stop:1682 length:1125 start_codon:yes stop_codon:yes gene_type:complete
MKYNIWNKWDPLQVCMLGNNYFPEFFNGLNNKAEDSLKRICEETLEDLDNFKNILEKFGVEVIQPEMNPKERFIDNPHVYPRGPLQPRDHQLVLGNKCYSYNSDHPAIYKKLSEYGPISKPKYKFPNLDENTYDLIAGSDFPSFNDFSVNRTNKEYFKDFVWQELLDNSRSSYLSSAMCFMIGDKLHIGKLSSVDGHLSNGHVILPEDFNKFDVKFIDVEGHTDGNFHPVKPGALISLKNVQNYSENYPGWDVCYLEDQSWKKVREFTKLKQKNQGKWWVAGEENNDEFIHFVESWLTEWVGYVEETVFDVNVLMLDQNHCCVSQTNNEKVNCFFKKHKIEPIHVPFRHRYFWDGGLHCITLDLYRKGTQQNYF